MPLDIHFIIGYNGHMKQNDTDRKNVKVEQPAYEKLFILAHYNLVSMTKLITRLVEAEWVTYLIETEWAKYLIETNGGKDKKQG